MLHYSINDLPTFKPGTQGHMKPKPGSPVAAMVAPADGVLKRPPSWGPGADLSFKTGTWLCAQDSKGDVYPNQEFGIDYVLLEPLNPATDPRAAYLVGYWAHAGHDVTSSIHLAQKTKNAIVLGEIAQEAIGGVFMTTEGPVTLFANDRILQSPNDESFVWVCPQTTYTKKYLNQGELFEGRG